MINICVVSMIGDHYSEKWTQTPFTYTNSIIPQVSKEEFDALKKDVEEMKALLKRAKIYDIEHGEKDCEMAEKVALLRKMAEFVGVSLEDVL